MISSLARQLPLARSPTYGVAVSRGIGSCVLVSLEGASGSLCLRATRLGAGRTASSIASTPDRGRCPPYRQEELEDLIPLEARRQLSLWKPSRETALEVQIEGLTRATD